MSGFEYLGLVVLAAPVLYVVVRLASAAWFKSKSEFERQNNGKQ